MKVPFYSADVSFEFFSLAHFKRCLLKYYFLRFAQNGLLSRLRCDILRPLIALAILTCAALNPAVSQNEGLDQSWRWIHFTTDDGLPSNQVYRVVETPAGTFWALTSRGLAYYNNYRWNSIDSVNGVSIDGIEAALISYASDSIAVKVGKDFYVGTKSGFRLIIQDMNQAWSYEPSAILIEKFHSFAMYRDGKLVEYKPICESPPGGFIGFYESSDDGSALLAFSNGLYELRNDSLRVKIPRTRFNIHVRDSRQNLKGTGLAIIEQPIEQRGLWEWGGNQKAHLNRTERPYLGDILALAENDDAIVIHHGSKIRIRLQGEWQSFDVPSYVKNITYTRFSRNGDIWFCGEKGLFVYRRSSDLLTSRSFKESVPRNNIGEILFSKKGDLWLATGDGIEHYSSDGTNQHIAAINNTPLYDLTGLEEDSEGNIWISSGSGFGGSFRWDGKEWRFFPIIGDPAGCPIHKIRKDREGNLWFLGISKYGVEREIEEPGAFKYSNGVFEHWGTDKDPFLARVYAFAEGPDSALWFGTLNGLVRYKEGEKTRHFSSLNRHSGIFTVAVDSNNTVWFGDREHGLGYLATDLQIHFFTPKDGLLNNAVWDLKVGNQNELWISTTKGLCRYDRGQWSNFGEQQGLNLSHLWPLAIHDNKVYVGSNGGGFAILNLSDTAPPPNIEIDKIVSENNETFIRWIPRAYWEELPSSEIQTRYRVDKGSWTLWNKTHEATLTLPPGNHYFQVQAQGLFGRFIEKGQQASFTITPPFYLHPGFFVPIGVSFLALIMLSLRYIQKKRIHDKALRLSESKFRRLTEATFEGVLLHDRGNIIDANQSASKIFGYEHHELIGKAIVELIAPEAKEETNQHILTEQGVPFETRGLKKDGQEMMLEIISRYIPSENKKISVAAIRDVSERKQAEKKIIEYQEKLRSLASDLSLTEERERRRMATYLHDYIGQTLALCRIKLGMLKSLSPVDGNEKEWSELKDILDQSIQDTRTLTFELSPPILHELSIIESLEWLVEHITNQYGIEISLKNRGSVPFMTEDYRTIIFHGVRELLINACKHSKGKHVSIKLRDEQTMYEVSVEDDGIGFSATLIEKRKDLGFGLFNLRERLDHFGGKLQIISRPEHGTRAIMTIPLNLLDTTKINYPPANGM